MIAEKESLDVNDKQQKTVLDAILAGLNSDEDWDESDPKLLTSAWARSATTTLADVCHPGSRKLRREPAWSEAARARAKTSCRWGPKHQQARQSSLSRVWRSSSTPLKDFEAAK